VESDLAQNAPTEASLLNAEEETPPQPPLEVLKAGPVIGRADDEAEKDDAFSLSQQDLRRLDQKKSQEIAATFKLRQEVTIRVMAIHPFGASVVLLDHPPCRAFLPLPFFPASLQSEKPATVDLGIPQKRLQIGMKRKVLIYSLNPELGDSKGGIVVSALHYDQNLLFYRLVQIRNLCNEASATIRGYVIDRVFRGMLVVVAGYTCFMPSTHIGQQARAMFSAGREDFIQHFKNSEIDVVIKEVERVRSRVIVSNLHAESAKALRSLRIGSLIHGRITDIKPYGVFVSMNDTKKSGLLHVRHMSKVHIREPEELFSLGEKIYAVILDMDPSMQRYSLSTADLEVERGEMLYNKELVMQNAPAMAARLQKELEDAREAHLSENHKEKQ